VAEPHVALRGVRKVFAGVGRTGPVEALGPLDLELARGEFFAGRRARRAAASRRCSS
jgi:hypothetical protein